MNYWAEEHAEWHVLHGVKSGPSGGVCPWDACGWDHDEEERHMIKCGNCKERHETVAEVRGCYGGTLAAPSVSQPEGGGQSALWDVLEQGAASKRAERGAAFLGETSLPGPAGKNVYYKKIADALPDLERARYAVEIDGELKFYQLDKPKSGNWVGYTFVKVQAGDETYPVKNLDSRIKVIDAILEGPEEAMLRYGREIGKCGHCGRTLTNEESREYGIGPICRGKMGW